MSREAFNSLAEEEKIWAAFNAWHKNRYGWDLRDTRGHAAEKYDGMVAWGAWQAARAAALEEAVDVCRKLDKEGKPDNPEYGSWGEFDDAEQAIRALKEKE